MMGSLPVGNIVRVWAILVVPAILLVQPSDAQTQVGFEFFQKYSLISHDVDSFKRYLLADINARYNFSSTRSSVISPYEVTNGTEGSIRVNLTLTIDTDVKTNVIARDKFETSLRTSDYVLGYDDLLYAVNSATVWFVVSFWDIWHELIAEIIIAVLCGLAAIALFIATIQLLCMNLKKRNAMYAPRSSLPVSYSGNSMGRTNGGFVMDELNGGHRTHTPKSSIGSTRFGHDRDTIYNKLTYAAYEVPSKHMYSFL